MFDTCCKNRKKGCVLTEVRGRKSIQHPASFLSPSAIYLFNLNENFADRGIYHIMVVAFVTGDVADCMDDV